MQKKCLLIGGAGSGYGRQILETLLSNNFHVILTSRYLKNLDKINNKYKNQIKNISTFKLNLNNLNQVKNFTKKIKKKFRSIDILINNAGANNLKNFDKQTFNDWNEVMNVNVLTNIFISREILKLMNKKKICRIINISSIYGINPPKHRIYGNSKINSPLIYGVSKAAIIHITKYLASIVPPNIRVNCISPGGLEAKQDKFFKKNYVKFTSVKRMANKNDLKGLIQYLISDSSNYITGQNLILDGGWSLN